MNEKRAPGSTPFKQLGSHIKFLREQHKESLAEVSGAVEIDSDKLERIEQGTERPSEDILLLLISHFDMQDQEAVQLWELAGYDSDFPDKTTIPDSHMAKSAVVMLAFDVRTMYTDGIEIDVDKSGLTMNFTQSCGQAKTAPVAKVGMSYQQAYEVLKALQNSLIKAKYASQPKALPHKSSVRKTRLNKKAK